MDELLHDLLNLLEQIGEQNQEIYDSHCREQMGNIVFDGFIRPVDGFVLPLSFGMHSSEANNAVRTALGQYISNANATALGLGINTFHERLAAFQNGDVRSVEGNFYDDFFGHSAPELFDANGHVIQ